MDFPQSDDPLVCAVQRLVARLGSCKAVADQAGANDQSIYQIAFLKPDSKTGKLKSVSPSLRKRLSKAFPDWLQQPASTPAIPVQEMPGVFRIPPRTDRDAEALLHDLRLLLERIPESERKGMAGLWASFCNSAGAEHHMNALLALLKPWSNLPEDYSANRVAGA